MKLNKKTRRFFWMIFFRSGLKRKILTSVEGHGTDGEPRECQHRSDFRAHRYVEYVVRAIFNFIFIRSHVAVRGLVVRGSHFNW